MTLVGGGVRSGRVSLWLLFWTVRQFIGRLTSAFRIDHEIIFLVSVKKKEGTALDSYSTVLFAVTVEVSEEGVRQ